MSTFLKPVVLGLGLVLGIAINANAQTLSSTAVPGPSIASLPPQALPGPRTSSANYIPNQAEMPVTPSGRYPGPKLGWGGWYGEGTQSATVQPSPKYIGPRPN
jgi:hypothetical protein